MPRGACSRRIGGPGERQLGVVLVEVCSGEEEGAYRRSRGCVSESKKAYAAAACFKAEGSSPWRLLDSTRAVLLFRRRSCTAITPRHTCPNSTISSLLLSSSSSSFCRVSTFREPYTTDLRSWTRYPNQTSRPLITPCPVLSVALSEAGGSSCFSCIYDLSRGRRLRTSIMVNLFVTSTSTHHLVVGKETIFVFGQELMKHINRHCQFSCTFRRTIS